MAHTSLVADVPDEFARRIDAVGADRESGASDILRETLALLGQALAQQIPAVAVGRRLCRAQPSMAPVWNAAIEAVAAEHQPGRFERFARRAARAPQALARFGTGVLGDGSGPVHLVTLSRSGSVRVVVDALRQQRPIRVSCSESRPAFEGRRLAASLAAAGVPVTCFSDAALAHALDAADAAIVGADAIGPEGFLNKSGTRMLAAAASQQGVPVYVVASRDKFVSRPLAARLIIREGAAADVWDAPPPGVAVRNPYFEWTPLDVITAVISDAGVLGVGMVPDVCDSLTDPQALAALDELGG